MRIILLSLLFTCTLAMPATASCLRIGIDPHSFEDNLGKDLSTASRHSDICFTFVEMPWNSPRTSLQNGFLDGELARSMAYIEALPEPPVVVYPPITSSQKYLVSVAPFTEIQFLRKPMTGFLNTATWADSIFQDYPKLRPVRFETLRSMMAELLTGQLKAALVSDRDYAEIVTLYNLNKHHVGSYDRYLLLSPQHADKTRQISEMLATLVTTKSFAGY